MRYFKVQIVLLTVFFLVCSQNFHFSHLASSGEHENVVCGYIQVILDAPSRIEYCDGGSDYIGFLAPCAGFSCYVRITNPIYGRFEFSGLGGTSDFFGIIGYDDITTISSCNECIDPCDYKFCPSYECRGCDYYESVGCSNGECLFTLVERDSPKCGSGCGDPCRDVYCEPTCSGCDYWAMECVNGDCVKDNIVEKDSRECGCEPDPCKEDSDHDGVKNCEDRCSDTPEWMSQALHVDSEGCLYCLDKETRCALSVTLLTAVPSAGMEDIILDFCEIIAKLADGDLEGAIKETVPLIRDIFFMAVRVLAGGVTLPLGASGEKVVGALQTMLTCLPALSSSEVETAFGESVQMMADENIDALSFYVGSPVNIEVTDDRGNTLTESIREIPNSYIFTIGNNEVGFIVNPAGEYKIEVQGAGSGAYDLRITYAEGGEITYDKKYNNVQTSRGEVDTYKANAYNVEVKDEEEKASLVYSLPFLIIGILAGLYINKKRRKIE